MTENDAIYQAYTEVLAKKSISDSLDDLVSRLFPESIINETICHNCEPITEVRIAKTSKGSFPIEIRMEPDNHMLPHLHINYGPKKHRASYDISTEQRLAGRIPNKDEKILKKWISDNKDTLMNNWNILKKSKTPYIEPIKYPIK